MKIMGLKGVGRGGLKKIAGVFKGTELDEDSIWKEVFKRKSRPLKRKTKG